MLYLILGTIAVAGAVWFQSLTQHKKTAITEFLSVPVIYAEHELREGYHMLVDRPQNTIGQDHSNGSPTTVDLAMDLKKQYQTEALSDPGVRMAANAIE